MLSHCRRLHMTQEKKRASHPLAQFCGHVLTSALSNWRKRALWRYVRHEDYVGGIYTASDSLPFHIGEESLKEFLLQQCLNGTSFFVPLSFYLSAFRTRKRFCYLNTTKNILEELYFCTSFARKSTRNASWNGVPSAPELPPRLRGCHQPDGQHGAVCFLHLHLYGKKDNI